MTGKVLDNGATGILALILPIAFLIVVVFAAWPYLLLVLVLTIAWQVWQIYQWQQWSIQVNPYFSELVKENQGCLTVMDLSLKTNITGRAAKRFLDKKAEEYGAQRKEIEDKGVVYYFLTASALGSILDESEPLSELEISELESQEVAPEKSPQLASASPEVKKQPPESSTTNIAQLLDVEPELPKQEESKKSPESPPDSLSERANKLASLFAPKKTSQESPTVKSLPPETALQSEQPVLKAMIQGDLAKRLDVHSSTVGKRRDEPDFAQWSQTKDPDGIAWKYSRKKRMYVPIEPD